MFGTRVSSVVASGILLLGSGAIALAQTGGPTGEPPERAVQAREEGDEVWTLELHAETATDRAGDGEGATEFSRWVSENPMGLEGCQRGQTIAKYARQGPHGFDPADVTPVPEDELPGRCATDGGAVDGDAGQGPPDHAARPDHAGQPGPPPHAGQPGRPPHAGASRK